MDVVAYRAAGALDRTGVIGYHLAQPADEVGAVAVHGHDVGQLGREPVVDGYLAAARLVEHRHLGVVAETALPFGEQQVYILYVAVVAYLIVGHIVGNVLDEAIVANRAVVQGDVAQPGVFP